MELHITGLSKTYPNGVAALRDVNLTIRQGIFGLLGPNGAGKSTLMRTLATLQDADGGSVQFEDGGQFIDVLRNKDAVRRVLGYLPQDFGVYPKVSAERLLDHLARLKGMDRAAERREAVAALLHQTNLYHVRRKPMGGFSGGMRQRFGIAQALLGRPKLIIVDEPTAGLDPEERVRFHNLLTEIGEDVIVILSTHIVADVAELCPQLALLEGGRLRLTGSPADLVRRLEGRIYEASIARADLAEAQERYDVISTRLASGATFIRVFAPERPGPQFTPLAASLEDVYFAAIGGHLAQPAEPSAALSGALA